MRNIQGNKAHPISLIIVILTVWAGSILSSCTQKDLVCNSDPVKVMVDFDWIDATGAKPDGMTVLFFPADENSQIWRFDITGRNGGEIEILSGIYNVIAFNNDLPGIEFSNTDSFSRLSGSTRNINDSVTSQTGMLYAASLTNMALYPGNKQALTICMTPDSLATDYHISLDSVTGTQRIKTATAILKGLARSVCLQLKCNSEQTCCVSVPLYIDPHCQSRMETVATGFGNPDIHDPKINLEIIVTTSHGKYSKTFDVTEQIMNSKHPKDVYINIKGLDIPEADDPTNPDGNSDVGISVGVDGWQLIEIFYS